MRPGWESAAAGAKFVPCGEGCLSGFLSLFFEDPNSMGRPHPHPVLLWGEAACKPQPWGHTEDRGSGPVVDHADSSVSWDLAHLRLLRVWREGPVFVGAVLGRCGALLCVSVAWRGCGWLPRGRRTTAITVS